MFLIIMSLTGCASHEVRHAVRNDAFSAAVDGAFAELDAGSRRPASDVKTMLGLDFKKLRGRLGVIVFPKISNKAEKSSRHPLRAFASPREFELVAQRLLNCQQLLKEKTKKWSHQEYFPGTIDERLECGIFRVTQSRPKLTAVDLRRDDIAEMRIYLDSDYRAYGVDIDIIVDRNNSAITNIKWDEREHLSSGLALFPIDLPNLSRLDAMTKKTTDQAQITLPDDVYVKNKLLKAGVKLCQLGHVFEYRDFYGSKQRIQWCVGNPWPATVENDRYFAVLKNQ